MRDLEVSDRVLRWFAPSILVVSSLVLTEYGTTAGRELPRLQVSELGLRIGLLPTWGSNWHEDDGKQQLNKSENPCSPN
jgi:hypothetical protein